MGILLGIFMQSARKSVVDLLNLTPLRVVGRSISKSFSGAKDENYKSEEKNEKLSELEKHLIDLNSGDEGAVKSVIEEFSVNANPDEESILHKQKIIDNCFSKDSVEEIIKSLEAEANMEGNGWIGPVLKGLKRSSPTGLKLTFRSIREGRKKTLAECLKTEFRLSINILRRKISGDFYEGIRALTVDKDNAPKWDPATLDQVSCEKVDSVVEPFEEELELQIPTEEGKRWHGKYENSAYSIVKATNELK
ncbi:hypothetical protein GIB67_022319 [Kingdonia uniflora]|uniref:3-hydroxyisobutyryl-CoA hydrolase n=1 Tax=Kingdonia uniflora TaxID=39325 RepID=A0A7J7KW24_9MAGN|nr:hypothetical protein GIB67_022319 [Kingdonia uniflora]